MTEQEALHFANCLKNNYTIDFNDLEAFCDLAIDALEKQIPKEPSDVYGKDIVDWTCGRCGRFHRNDYKLRYCSECGQAIKWE